MREVVISIQCDMCQNPIEEQTEGSNRVSLTVYGLPYEMDACDDCIHGSYLQEARPVTTKKWKQKGEFACGCGKSFATERGRSAHSTRAHSD